MEGDVLKPNPLWIIMGLMLEPSFGLLLGVAMNNIGIGLSLGTSAGLLFSVLGMAISGAKNSRK